MDIKDLSPAERRLLNIKILEYNESRKPLPVFLEILKLDVSDRPWIKQDLYEIIKKIAKLLPVDSV